MRPLILSFFLLGFVSPEEPKDDLTKAELARHQGVWATMTFEHEGQKGTDDVVKSVMREVSGDHVVWRRNGKPFSGSSITLDIKAIPKSIDVVPDGAQVQDKLVRGIYKLDGDTLTICMAEPGQPRPKEFKASKETHNTLMTLRRVSSAPTGARRNPRS